jgi:hypothetical protein
MFDYPWYMENSVESYVNYELHGFVGSIFSFQTDHVCGFVEARGFIFPFFLVGWHMFVA